MAAGTGKRESARQGFRNVLTLILGVVFGDVRGQSSRKGDSTQWKWVFSHVLTIWLVKTSSQEVKWASLGQRLGWTTKNPNLNLWNVSNSNQKSTDGPCLGWWSRKKHTQLNIISVLYMLHAGPERGCWRSILIVIFTCQPWQWITVWTSGDSVSRMCSVLSVCVF